RPGIGQRRSHFNAISSPYLAVERGGPALLARPNAGPAPDVAHIRDDARRAERVSRTSSSSVPSDPIVHRERRSRRIPASPPPRWTPTVQLSAVSASGERAAPPSLLSACT